MAAVWFNLAAAALVRFRASDAAAMRCYRLSMAACERRVFSVFAERAGDARLRVVRAGDDDDDEEDDDDAILLAVHGVLHGPASKAAGPGTWAVVSLRRGVNTVEVEARRGSVTALEVDGAAFVQSPGAIVPFVELEAEDAATLNGTIVGPDFTFTHLPSEASARRAVLLSGAGEFVEFVAPVPFNAVSIRFSIPDAPAGGGLDTPLSLFLNDSHVQDVVLTSRYAWYYGSYPFTKNPADGSPHHFFDEVNVLLGPSPVPAGSRLRLQAPAGIIASSVLPSCAVADPAKRDCGFYGINETMCLSRACCWDPITPNPTNIPYCFFPSTPTPTPSPTPTPPPSGPVPITLDLVDLYLVDPPLAPPPDALSVVSTGADPSGATDSTASFLAAITKAAQTGQVVWVPPGNFTVTAHLVLPDNTTLAGAGPWHSILHGAGVGVFGNAAPQPSRNVQVRDLALVGEVKIRDDSSPMNGVGGALEDSIVSNVWIAHQKCGVWVDGPFENLLVTGCTIRDTTADGVNFHDGIQNSVVEYCSVRNTGDDGLAMWSDSHADTNNTFRFNTVQVPVLANNIAIYGGADNAVLSNAVADSVTQGGGLHVGNRFSAVPLAGTTTLAGNVVVRAGCLDPDWQFGVGALWFYALDSPLTGTVVVEDTTILASPFEAVQFLGSSVTNVSFDNLTVTDVGTFVFQLQCPGRALVADVVALGVGFFGQYNCGVAFDFEDEGGNEGWNTTHCGWPGK